jgi:hypothetical protein
VEGGHVRRQRILLRVLDEYDAVRIDPGGSFDSRIEDLFRPR